jgi:hypothetical protein
LCQLFKNKKMFHLNLYLVFYKGAVSQSLMSTKRKASNVLVKEGKNLIHNSFIYLFIGLYFFLELTNDIGMKISCDSCFKDISHVILIQCAECDNLDLCVECFGSSVELSQHKATHSYRVLRPFDFPVYTADWRADEELLLIEGCEQFGVGNWKDISEHIGSKEPEACQEHFHSIYLNWPGAPNPNPRYQIKAGPEKPAILMPSKVAPIVAKKTKKDADVHEPTPVSLQSVPANHEITGYMPGRREFETETENEAEIALKDLQFNEEDSAFDISNTIIIIHQMDEIVNIFRFEIVNVRNLFRCFRSKNGKENVHL